MKKQWLIIGGVVVGLCCLSSMCLAVAGSDKGFNAAADQLAKGNAPTKDGDVNLVGTWSSTSTSLVGYKNVATGAWAPPSGNSMSLELHDDGTCVQAALMQSSLYGCSTYIFAYIDDCSWSVNGSKVDVELGEGETRMKGCGSGEEKRGETKGGPHLLTLELDTDGKPVLRDGSFNLRRAQ
ncbi:MAG: hypothetical protein QM817_02005 [Archangium sp.]